MLIFAAAAHSQQAITLANGSKAKPINSAQTKKLDTVKAAAAINDSTAQQLITVQGSLEGFQVLIQALDASNASHVVIEQLKQWIIPQVNAQLKTGPPKK